MAFTSLRDNNAYLADDQGNPLVDDQGNALLASEPWHWSPEPTAARDDHVFEDDVFEPGVFEVHWEHSVRTALRDNLGYLVDDQGNPLVDDQGNLIFTSEPYHWAGDPAAARDDSSHWGHE